MTTTPVLIAGGGPAGMLLAMELDHHGIDAILIERNPGTTRHPKMDITNARSMEVFRRLGLVEKLRAVAVSADNPTSVVWCTNMLGDELARFDYPSVNEQYRQLHEENDGSMALEPAMRVSQVVLEPVFKQTLDEECSHITTMFGWGLDSFTQDDGGVTARIRCSETDEVREVRAQYLAGCDGAGSVVRRGLNIPINIITPEDFAKSGDRTDYMDEPKGFPSESARDVRYMIHFRAVDEDFMLRFGMGWHIQSPLGWNIIAQNDKDIWTIHVMPHLLPEDLDNIDAKTVLFDALGAEFDCEILIANLWSPRLGLADSYGSGRVWLAGDAVHQVIPTGGYGMNCAVGDTMALGWALTANINGWGTPKLFEAYEVERRHAAARYRLGAARHSSLRRDILSHTPDNLMEDSEAGKQARKQLGDFIQQSGNLENEAWGIEWGYRYDDSPVICHEQGEAPDYEWEHYEPSTWPGVRAPNFYTSDGTPMLDLLGTEFTLLNFTGIDCKSLVNAAEEKGVPLSVVNIDDPKAAKLYQRNLVLVRPDQHVAWRADQAPENAEAAMIMDRVRGA